MFWQQSKKQKRIAKSYSLNHEEKKINKIFLEAVCS